MNDLAEPVRLRARTFKTSIATILATAVLLALVMAETLFAQLPAARLYSLFPSGGRRGEQVDVVIGGADLELVRELRFSHPGVTATPKTSQKEGDAEPKPIPNAFRVSIAADVPSGVYEARAVGAYGVSTSQAFVVGHRVETMEKEPNDKRELTQQIEIGQVVNGRCDRDGDLDFYHFHAKQGNRLLIQCEAERIDSHFRPIMTLYNSDGRILKVYREMTFDAMLDFVVPKDGNYVLEVRDLIYGRPRIGAPRGHHFYRLTVDRSPYIDFIFPPAGKRGSTGKYTVYGRNLPGSKPAEDVALDGRPLDRLEVEIALPNTAPANSSIEIFQRQRVGCMVAAPSASMEGVEYRLAGEGIAANPVFIGFATADVVIEHEPNDDPSRAQSLQVPCEVAGQFASVGDRDWFVFEAQKDQVFEIEVLSQRLGVAADAFLVLQQVKQSGDAVDLAEVDDRPLSGVAPGALKNNGRYAFNTNTDDPGYRFVAPADGTYRIMVRDMYHMTRGDPRFVYRLSIRREQPDFRLVSVSHYPEDLGPQNRNREPWPILLRRGGTERIDVLAFRWDGFAGDIAVSVEGLPTGVTCQKTIFRPGQTAASLVVQAADNVSDWNGPIRIVGTATINGSMRKRAAEPSSVVLLGRTARFEPHSRRSLATVLSVVNEVAPLLVTVGQGKTRDAKRGETIKAPVTVIRRGEFKGPVQLIPVVLPEKVSSKVVTIPAGQLTGEVEITIDKAALSGEHRVVFEAKVDVPYRRAGVASTTAAKTVPARLATTPLGIRVSAD